MLPGILRIPILLLTLVAFLLTGPGGASAYVLCIGADGHAAYERGHDGGCGREEECPVPATPHCDGGTGHEYPCTDVQPSLSSDTPRSRPTVSAPALVAAVLLAPAALLLPDVAGSTVRLRSTDPHHFCHTLLVLRTTVLRC